MPCQIILVGDVYIAKKERPVCISRYLTAGNALTENGWSSYSKRIDTLKNTKELLKVLECLSIY